MEYEVRYDSYYRNNSLDWTDRIKAKNDDEAIGKAAQLVVVLNKEAKEKNTAHSYKLTGIFRVHKKRVLVTKEEFTPIFETSQF